MGRPKKPMAVSASHLSKKGRADREAQEAKLKVERGGLEPPSHLTPRAQEEFLRVVNECESIGILDNLDLSVLSIYAFAWDQYLNCAEMIQKEGPVIIKETPTGIRQTVSGYVSAQEKFAKQIMQCSSKLGLATTDRLKLVVPTEPEQPENRFLKYVNMNG